MCLNNRSTNTCRRDSNPAPAFADYAPLPGGIALVSAKKFSHTFEALRSVFLILFQRKGTPPLEVLCEVLGPPTGVPHFA